MDKDSRYFATVRRATMIPCSDSKEVNLLSLNGFAGFSAAINFFTSARIAVEGLHPAFSIDVTGKEIFQFKMPRGLCRYFLRGHRDIVDSCISTAGRYRPVPSASYILRLVQRLCCCSTIQRLTRSSVSLQLSRLLINHLASCRLLRINWLSPSLRVIAHRGRSVLVDLQTRNAVTVEFYRPVAVMLTHQHIWNDILRFASLDRLPGRGSSDWIRLTASFSTSSFSA